MVNPNKHIRTSIVSALSSVGTSVWYKRLPKTIATPEKYILIQSQSKQEAFRAKSCWEWLCQFNIEIVVEGEQGIPPTDAIDGLEQSVLSAMENFNVTSGGFATKYCDMINQYEDSVETDTNSIERRILTYEIWLSKK